MTVTIGLEASGHEIADQPQQEAATRFLAGVRVLPARAYALALGCELDGDSVQNVRFGSQASQLVVIVERDGRNLERRLSLPEGLAYWRSPYAELLPGAFVGPAEAIAELEAIERRFLDAVLEAARIVCPFSGDHWDDDEGDPWMRLVALPAETYLRMSDRVGVAGAVRYDEESRTLRWGTEGEEELPPSLEACETASLPNSLRGTWVGQPEAIERLRELDAAANAAHCDAHGLAFPMDR